MEDIEWFLLASAMHWFLQYDIMKGTYQSSVKKLGTIFTGPTYNLLLSFMVISDVCRSFIPNKTTFIKYFSQHQANKKLQSGKQIRMGK